MNISQSENILTITSQQITGYSYIHVIQDVTIADTTIAQETFTDSVSTYTFTTDGYYIITEMKLPTTPGAYYYIDNGKAYDPTGTEISVADLLEVDTTGTTIVKEDEDYITTYIINDYYINLLKNKYLNNICSCGCINKLDKVKIDTLTMGLDLIEALEETYQYYEIQRIVESLSSCYGLTELSCNCDG